MIDHLSDVARVAIEALKKSKYLIHGELFGQLRILQLDPEQLAKIAGIRLPVPAEHFDAARVGGEKTLADLDRGRLSGTVGAE